MANPWFRLYSEFSTDPKIQMLSESDQRRFVMLLCLKCCNGDVTLHDEEVAFQLRISNEEWLQSKAIFKSKNLINDRNQPANWSKRQFLSDSSTARVTRHRERKKQQCNVTVTPPDTDTNTDTEKNNISQKTPEIQDQFEIAWSHYPSRSGGNPKQKALKAWNARVKDGHQPQDIIDGVIRYLAWCNATGKIGSEFVKQAVTFFGPDKYFLEPWTIPATPNGANRHETKHQQSTNITQQIFGAAARVYAAASESSGGNGHGHLVSEDDRYLPQTLG